jgi:hypothetical protein
VAGTSGVILIVVGLGQTMKQAQAQVYSRIKNVMIPNMYYRTDIGDRWDEDSDRFTQLGHLAVRFTAFGSRINLVSTGDFCRQVTSRVLTTV